MNTSPANLFSPVLLVLSLAIPLMQGCAHHVQPQAFSSPDEAVQALIAAVRADDMPQLLKVVGSDGQPIISSGDEAADRIDRQKFLALYDEKHVLVDDGPDSKTLVIGKSDWPMPTPIVRQGAKWSFDSKAGKEELLNRRIGRNELSVIQVCKAIGDAQREYALRDPDGDGVHAYAQKFPSDPDKRNGLWWPVAQGEKPSPLGELVAAGAAEGYTRREEGPTPYHGYYYRILCGQGAGAPNGAMSYVVKGKMILGFAVLAYPAEYGNSGIMTFTMGVDGVVYQRDLGDGTRRRALAMKVFDPGDGWTRTE